MRFRLVNGSHMVSDGPNGLGTRTLKPGDVIESDTDLEAQLPNKFKRLDGPSSVKPAPNFGVVKHPTPSQVPAAPWNEVQEEPVIYDPLGDSFLRQ